MRFLATKLHPGFGLIEILVVIAIISLMLAILFPVLHKSKSLCQRMKCSNNLRQISLGWESYLDDNNGRFPKGPNMNKYFGGYKPDDPNDIYNRRLNSHVGLTSFSERYVENNIFYCPSDTPANNNGIIFYEEDGNSYQANPYLIGPDQLPDSSDLYRELNKRIADLTRETITANPSALILMGDTPWRIAWNYSKAPIWHEKSRHFNMAFLDGRVELLEIFEGKYRNSEYNLIPFNELRDSIP